MGGIGNGAQVAPYSPKPDKEHHNTELKLMKPSGLKNVGNTCYANAALQCILSTALSHALLDPTSTHVFREYSSNPALLAVGSGEADSDNDSDEKEEASQARLEKQAERQKARLERRKRKEKLLNHEKCQWLTGELTDITRVYTSLNDSPDKEGWSMGLFHLFSTTNDHHIVDPGGVTRHVHKISKTLRPYQQEDAHEFLRSLLSNLTLDGHNKQLSSLFDGLLESVVTCQKCYRASVTRDRYMDLSLDIQSKDISSLYQALEYFTKTELIDQDNQVFCARCKTKRIVSKGMRLATAPSVLVCHLKRFSFDSIGRTTRISKFVQYPEKLDIGDFMSRANKGKPRPYELVGVLVHTGTRCDRGHYLAYVKSGCDWFRCSDEVVDKVSIEEVHRQQAYILFYEVEGMRKGNGYVNFTKYHRQSCDKKVNMETIATPVKDNKVGNMDRRTSTPQEKISDLLDSMLSFCGAESAAQAIRDGICDTEKKDEKKSEEAATNNDLKKITPTEESTKSNTLKRSPNRDSIFRPPTPNKSPMRARSDHGARDIDFMRVVLRKSGTSKFSDTSLTNIPSSSRLIRSSSSNWISEMENEATTYKYSDDSFVSKKRMESPSPIRRLISRDAQPRSSTTEDVSHVTDPSKIDTNNKIHAISAPHSGRALIESSSCSNKSDDRLPPLPKNSVSKKCDS
jgi:ubiquitin carboxyl-terminal hydrolase 36/42